MVQLRSKKDVRTTMHLITGGGGYVGFWLGKTLVKKGHHVLLIDLRPPIWTLHNDMEFIQVDITDYSALEEVFAGVDCVYHMASYGMSGREQLNKKLIEAVNVQGTENVIQACIKHNVTRLVYTSTYNVIFGGQTIESGEETLAYLPLDKHPDHYSRTKSVAEQKVLAANGQNTEDGHKLRTCALRLAGVYGPGEQRHQPRIVSYIEKGYYCMTYGMKTKQDFLHVENVAQAHQLAGEALTEIKNYKAAGQAYFISDGAPINTFDFYRPLVEGLGYPVPTIQIPISLVYFFAILTEIIHSMVARIYNFQPLLTRTEVYKTGITHHFSIAKAQQDLGYHPTIQNDLSSVVQYYISTGHRRTQKQSSITYWIVNVIIMIIFACFILSLLPFVK
ncbi:hypothetical protein CHS0354_025510 [Potamilus streckersoni]|uniref:3-beta hydroxysteroid dehydrogenase/isomerase domain-containing protein n=1 Tax=Potamilus streckersoni TaxID=2493646 RepID=A0AAE0SLI5_9BIVA|nr:hypothetical protein CHS0354_025510 [Potamilus streckersoni]